jgi:hypothetical protein
MVRGKSEVWATLESILLVSDAGEGFTELALSTRPNELVLLPCDPHRQTWKVWQAADMVPVRMGQQNGTQRLLVVAGSLHLIDGGLPHTIWSDNTQAPRQRAKLLVNVTAEAGVDEQVALWVLYQGSGHGKFAPLEQRAAAISEGRDAMVHASHHREDGEVRRGRGRGQRSRVGFGLRQR